MSFSNSISKTLKHKAGAICCFATIGTISGQSLPAAADDGYISTGGNPHLMDKPTSVTMQSEHIEANINDNRVMVDCDFVFNNKGDACRVRMGFPDQSTSESPKGSFRSYKSYLDGKEVATEVVPGDKKEKSTVWHAKFVDFGAHTIRKVRDEYTDIEGGFQLPPDGAVHFFSYVLHTASSWNGPIGEGDVLINFNTLKKTPIPVDIRTIKNGDLRKFFRKAPAESIVYSGPCTPTLKGKTLIFHFANLRPKPESNISVFYQYVSAPKEKSIQ